MNKSESAKIGMLERFKLGKGITREAEQGIWTKEYIEIEVKLPENATNQDFVANFTATEYMIDQLLQAPATAAPTEKIAEAQGITPEEKPTFDPGKIKWTKEEGAKGPFEKSEDVNSLDFKNLVKDLNTHKGTLYQDGYFFWLYKSGSTVGRKLKGKAKAKESNSQDAKTIENIKQKFPQELQDLLSFEVQDEGAIIKPRQFLGSENFAKIADIVKAHGGDYVSAGKESHFKIPRKTS
jgi:hypothetical protein